MLRLGRSAAEGSLLHSDLWLDAFHFSNIITATTTTTTTTTTASASDASLDGLVVYSAWCNEPAVWLSANALFLALTTTLHRAYVTPLQLFLEARVTIPSCCQAWQFARIL